MWIARYWGIPQGTAPIAIRATSANGCAIRAMWIARYWDNLVLELNNCPYSEPSRIREWLRDHQFRADAMWIARYWDTLLSKVKYCPYSDPKLLRQWLRDQERVAKGLPPMRYGSRAIGMG
jgi:hypothetical protein